MSGASPDLAPRPAFAEDFPRAPDLDAMVEAFVRGDYAAVRRIAARVQSANGSEDVKRAARSLVDRTGTDPLAVGLLVLTGVLLVVLTAWWWRFNGPAPTTPRPPAVEHVH